MKRLLILFVVIVTVLSLLALPITADEASDTDEPKQTTSVSNENNNNGNKDNNDAEVNKDIIKYFTNPLSLLEFVEIDISTFKDGSFWGTLKNGGYNYFEGENNYINLMISKIYNITYPVGIVVMVLSWIFGIAKNSTNTALDIKDKNSLIRSMLGLVIGLAAMTAAPYVLTVLTSISNWLCVRISSISINTWFNDVLYCKKLQNLCEDGGTTINLFDIIEAFGSQSPYMISQFFYGIIVVIVIEFVFCLNMLWLALLQVISPIFIGLCASGGGRKLTFNFVKEYFKALLMPILSLIYISLCVAMLGSSNLSGVETAAIARPIADVLGLVSVSMPYIASLMTAFSLILGIIALIDVLLAFIFPLVLAISTLGIAGKKLDKLIN